MKHLFGLVLPLIVAALAAAFAVPFALGAHPQWAITVILIGTPLGIVVGWATSWIPPLPRLIAAIVLTLAAFATARYGRAEFGASFAEDVFAGQLWHFGWISTCGFAALTASTLGYILFNSFSSRFK